MYKFLALAGVVLGLAYLATGVVVVQPNEEVIVRRFGRALPTPLPAGLHWELPWGLSQIDRVRVDTTRQVSLGTLTPGTDQGLLIDEPDTTTQGRFLTGDQNLVQLAITIQYSLGDSRAYLFNSVDADRLIANCAEGLVTELAAHLPVDEILLDAQASMQPQLQQRLQQILDDRYDLGAFVQSINIAASPPQEVQDAFDDVSKARSDKEKKVNEAYSYSERTLQNAEADAEKLLNQANVYAQRQLADANSRAQRFSEMLAAYRASPTPGSVMTRYYVETLEQLLPRIKKVLIESSDGQPPVDLSIWRESE